MLKQDCLWGECVCFSALSIKTTEDQKAVKVPGFGEREGMSSPTAANHLSI